MLYTVKPDELVQLKLFEETDCLKPFKFINSNNLSMKNSLICVQVTQVFIVKVTWVNKVNSTNSIQLVELKTNKYFTLICSISPNLLKMC